MNLKVAIIGAGTSGLSCAIELERNGVTPVIFERNDFIGEYHPHVSAFLELIVHPAEDPLKYLHHKLGIKLDPLNQLQKVIHYSPNNQLTVSGSLGYLMVRGKEEYSVKNQLRKQVKTCVHFNSFVQPEDLEKEFDHVVVADGTWIISKRYGIWQEIMNAWVKGAIFEGDFEENTLKMWLDNELTKGVYIYAAPYGRHKAVIAHVVQNIEHEELNSYWQRFLTMHDILKNCNMLESWELPHYSGFVSTNRLGKLYFVGAAGGGVEPFLGFGQFNAIVTGVMAARSITQGTDINYLLKDLREKAQELNTLRSVLNKATNQDLDRLLAAMKTPGLRTVVYNTNIDITKILSDGLKLAGIADEKLDSGGKRR